MQSSHVSHGHCHCWTPCVSRRSLKVCKQPVQRGFCTGSTPRSMAPEQREYDRRWNGIWGAGLDEGEVGCVRHLQVVSRSPVEPGGHAIAACTHGCRNSTQPAARLPCWPSSRKESFRSGGRGFLFLAVGKLYIKSALYLALAFGSS